ncbi:MAG TPA: riboflavin synthase [Sphingomonas sp.]|jgi:riboflavin synthase|uniref:riboflavin synthase n=1 Tax=Sphingomonas sp. TaxID=28214 RepID=UPI002ED9DCBC
MFTGIITDVGRIDAVEARGDTRLRIRCAYDMAGVDLGASIACAGVCLTVVDKGADWFAVDLSAESVSRTAPVWKAGQALNLERALKIGDELGGHIVTGHVDGVGTVLAMQSEGGSWRLDILVPTALAPYVAGKGSVTIDGVSLTINTVHDRADGPVIGLNIIPHTASVTTLGSLAAGDHVHVEIDVLARYLGRMEALRHVVKA